VDTRKDLNAYSAVDGQSACCPPPALESVASLAVVNGSCSPAPNPVHGGPAELLKTYNLNEYAASVQVYAIKP
jgi:hypothetical protein